MAEDGIYRDEILALARSRSDASRAELFTVMGDLFHAKNEILSAQERALMLDILEKLLTEVARAVRHRMALKLAGAPGVPRELAVLLANDEIEIATPILMKCSALEDIDLIEVIRNRSRQHILAVAMRRDLSTQVSDALVETGDKDVIRTLLENQDAAISRATLAYLVEQSKAVDEFQEPLVRRTDLPADLARRMVFWVGAAIRQALVERFDIDPDLLDDRLEPLLSEEADSAAAAAAEEDAADVLSRALGAARQLTPRLLLQTLRRGEIPLFEAMFAEMSGLRLRLISRIAYESGGQGLAVVARGIGLNREEFATIFLLTRRARIGQPGVVGAGFAPADLGRALEFFDRLSHAAAETVLNRWRRDPDYLFAIRSIEDGQEKKSA
ncbi:uncharacterized protein (DUF2336 family) [Dongia mobilis]|uniref:Uncharacterized protein (DUF2336 family) n=1 Tax=Dongia mobilis TaxID=578943 RepID=A0A4R6WWJ0_9PROT|nr:DUF2336 domain-containing protein [Dongia mobilis]TDQ84047.1 uncharacterized protein (DUF2336 family) [Dongia mobilis]